MSPVARIIRVVLQLQTNLFLLHLNIPLPFLPSPALGLLVFAYRIVDAASLAIRLSILLRFDILPAFCRMTCQSEWLHAAVIYMVLTLSLSEERCKS